jgi:hypothetical protein
MAEIQVAKPPKGKSKVTDRDGGNAGPRTRGPHGRFSGSKLHFLESRRDNYNAKAKTKEATIFYSEVTRAFIERFGYNLGYGENPKDDQEVKDLGPMPVATFPEEEQAAEHERRDEYYTELRQVSEWHIARASYVSQHETRSFQPGIGIIARLNQSRTRSKLLHISLKSLSALDACNLLGSKKSLTSITILNGRTS